MTAFPEKECCQMKNWSKGGAPANQQSGDHPEYEVEMEAKAGPSIPERLEHGVKLLESLTR